MAVFTLDDLLTCLEVRQSDDGTWTAPNLPMDYYRIFGGQLLAQAIAVSAATAEGKTVKSISCQFPREGDATRPLELAVDEAQTGRAFAARRVTAEHDGKVFFLAQLSLHVDEDGPSHQDPPPDVGTPEDATPRDLNMIPWETRIVGDVDLEDRTAGPADYSFWMRVGDRQLPESRTVHQALLAHATDLTVIGTALRPHEGVSQADSTVTLHTAVTSHQLWFHRPFRLDDWCLVSQHSPVAAGARAFGQGHVFDADGNLVASFAQESMIRPIPQESS